MASRPTSLRVLELQAVDDDAEAAMWNYLFGIDLVGTSQRPTVRSTTHCAGGSPIRDGCGSVSCATTSGCASSTSALHSRPARTPPTTRSCSSSSTTSAPRTTAAGSIEGGPDGATCTRTDRAADLTLSAADLGALYLGGVPVSTLAAAGRVHERTTGAVARGDRAFLVHPSPWCTTHF